MRWTYAHTEAAVFIAACILTGAALGIVVTMVRPLTGERHG